MRLYDVALSKSQLRALFVAGKGTAEGPSEVLATNEVLLQADWLFQAEGADLLERTGKEITWTQQMIRRLQKHPAASSPAKDLPAPKALHRAPHTSRCDNDSDEPIRSLVCKECQRT